MFLKYTVLLHWIYLCLMNFQQLKYIDIYSFCILFIKYLLYSKILKLNYLLLKYLYHFAIVIIYNICKQF